MTGSQIRRVLWAWLLALAVGAMGMAARPALALDSSGPLNLHIALHDVDAERARPLERVTRQALREVEQDLHATLSGNLYVDFVGSPEAFSAVMREHKVQGFQEAWISGLALLDQDRVIAQVNGPGALLTSEVVRHELAHVALHALSGDHWLPRWYHEGVAMYLAGEATFERLRESSGAAAFGELDNLAALSAGFSGSQIGVQRAYATAAGFMRFAVGRAGSSIAITQLHQRMRGGLDFPAAFTATFGLRPDALYELYAAYVGNHASRWTLALTDSTLWALVSILAVLAMSSAWRNRPRFEDDGEPLDLEAIAAAGQAALVRPWHRRDFTTEPLAVIAQDPGPTEVPAEPPAAHAEMAAADSD